jgi:regulator of sigma E protease
VRNIGNLHRYLQLNLGQEVTALVQHSDSTVDEIEVIPRWRPPQGEGAIGVTIHMPNPTITRQSFPLWEAVPMGAREYAETFVLFKHAILMLFIGAAPFQIAGPVGIAQLTGEVAKAGAGPLLEFAGFLSINFAIINMFPLPALDGGRIAFVLLELVRRGKRISAKTEELVHLIGFALLIGLFLTLTYQDITRILSGESLMP